MIGRASVDDRPRTFVFLVGVSLLVGRTYVDDRPRTFGLLVGVSLLVGRLGDAGGLLGHGGSVIQRWLQIYCWVLFQHTDTGGTGLQ